MFNAKFRLKEIKIVSHKTEFLRLVFSRNKILGEMAIRGREKTLLKAQPQNGKETEASQFSISNAN
jgi:hypothetical protein